MHLRVIQRAVHENECIWKRKLCIPDAWDSKVLLVLVLAGAKLLQGCIELHSRPYASWSTSSWSRFSRCSSCDLVSTCHCYESRLALCGVRWNDVTALFIGVCVRSLGLLLKQGVTGPPNISHSRPPEHYFN